MTGKFRSRRRKNIFKNLRAEDNKGSICMQHREPKRVFKASQRGIVGQAPRRSGVAYGFVIFTYDPWGIIEGFRIKCKN